MPEKSGERVTRRSIEEQKADFLREYYKAIRSQNEGAFRLLLRSWEIKEGSTEWRLAWEAWREELAARALKPPKGPHRPSVTSPRAPQG